MPTTADKNNISVDVDCMQLFDTAFSRIEYVLEYNPKWSNGMGMYDYAIYGEHAPRVASGKMARSSSPSGRRIILIGSRLGTIVIFERVTGTAKKPVITIHIQTTSQLKEGGWFSSQEPDDYELDLALGDERRPNLGQRIDSLYMAMKKQTV